MTHPRRSGGGGASGSQAPGATALMWPGAPWAWSLKVLREDEAPATQGRRVPQGAFADSAQVRGCRIRSGCNDRGSDATAVEVDAGADVSPTRSSCWLWTQIRSVTASAVSCDGAGSGQMRVTATKCTESDQLRADVARRMPSQSKPEPVTPRRSVGRSATTPPTAVAPRPTVNATAMAAHTKRIGWPTTVLPCFVTNAVPVNGSRNSSRFLWRSPLLRKILPSTHGGVTAKEVAPSRLAAKCKII